MHTVFKGWRRTAGVVLLVMACMMMVLWFRSRIVADLIGIPNGQRQTIIWSLDGKAYWFGCNAEGGDWFALTSRTLNKRLREGIDRQRAELSQKPAMEYHEWRVSYLPVAIGLTFFSAYLILWTPRKRVKQDA